MAGGATITITRHGVPVAVLSPPRGASAEQVRDAIAGLRAFRARHPLDGLTIGDLIDEGRR